MLTKEQVKLAHKKIQEEFDKNTSKIVKAYDKAMKPFEQIRKQALTELQSNCPHEIYWNIPFEYADPTDGQCMLCGKNVKWRS